LFECLARVVNRSFARSAGEDQVSGRVAGTVSRWPVFVDGPAVENHLSQRSRLAGQVTCRFEGTPNRAGLGQARVAHDHGHCVTGAMNLHDFGRSGRAADTAPTPEREPVKAPGPTNRTSVVASAGLPGRAVRWPPDTSCARSPATPSRLVSPRLARHGEVDVRSSTAHAATAA